MFTLGQIKGAVAIWLGKRFTMDVLSVSVAASAPIFQQAGHIVDAATILGHASASRTRGVNHSSNYGPVDGGAGCRTGGSQVCAAVTIAPAGGENGQSVRK